MDALSGVNQAHHPRAADGRPDNFNSHAKRCSCGWRGDDWAPHYRTEVAKVGARGYVESVLIPEEIARRAL